MRCVPCIEPIPSLRWTHTRQALRIATNLTRRSAMQLYFSPLACSMATRIALYEAGASASFCEIDPKTKLTLDGQRYLDIHPLGLVPALRTDDDQLITENAAILQYV